MLLQSKKTVLLNLILISRLLKDILKEIKMLQSNKATQNTDIPNKLIKDNIDILRNLFLLASISASVFPSKLKLANITPVHKIKLKKLKSPVSILSNISKVYEKIIFKQTPDYFELFL